MIGFKKLQDYIDSVRFSEVLNSNTRSNNNRQRSEEKHSPLINPQTSSTNNIIWTDPKTQSQKVDTIIKNINYLPLPTATTTASTAFSGHLSGDKQDD